jgi:hypothetical protein
MSTPIALTDEEMDAVLQAAAPIDPAQRDGLGLRRAGELSRSHQSQSCAQDRHADPA